MISTIAALWGRRDLIHTLAVSNLKEQHRNTLFGYLWWVLDPLMMTAVYTIVIGFIRGVGRNEPAFPAFVMCGLLAWKSFATTISQSIDVVSRSEGLVKSFSFPKAVLPISLVISNQVLFVFALIPLFALCLFYRFVMGAQLRPLAATWALVPLLVVVQLCLALGGALMFSCFGVFFRDLGNIMTHVLRIVWYLSPGLYPLSRVLKADYRGFLQLDWSDFHSIYLLNPFAHLMGGYRDCIMYGNMPDLAGIGFAFCLGVVGIGLGLWVFQNQERKFAKLV